jgi:Snf7
VVLASCCIDLDKRHSEGSRPTFSAIAMMQSVQRFLYGPTPEGQSRLYRACNVSLTDTLPTTERVRKWQRQLKTESRLLDREVRSLDAATANTRKQLKQLANKGEIKNARLLAREIVRTNKQRDRLVTSKARLNSIGMQLQHQLCGSVVLALWHRANLEKHSKPQNHRRAAEIHRDHEALQLAHPTTGAEQHHAKYEHGTVKGSFSTR